MFKLRPFKNSDAACMPSWIIDEREFYFGVRENLHIH